MIGRLLFFVSLIAVSVLPDNLADLAKLGDKPNVGKKPSNRVRGSRGRRRRGGHGHPSDEGKLDVPAIPPNPSNPGDDDNDAVRENRSGGPAGGGGGEPHSASQGNPDGLIADPAISPNPDNPAS